MTFNSPLPNLTGNISITSDSNGTFYSYDPTVYFVLWSAIFNIDITCTKLIMLLYINDFHKNKNKLLPMYVCVTACNLVHIAYCHFKQDNYGAIETYDLVIKVTQHAA